MIQYRRFRNDDPPGLVSLWNETFTGRGAVALRGCSPIEYFVFAKPYFDPAGLIVAVDGRTIVGFVHAAFGPAPDETKLNFSQGIICALGVRPSYQRRGIGSELLHQAEDYLTAKGARSPLAGSMQPWNPFYFGIYGGSDSPGFLASDTKAEPFFLKHGYQLHQTCLVLQRKLRGAVDPAEPRFAGLRRRYEMRVTPRTGCGTWWQECVIGPLELLDFRLEDRGTGQAAARAGVWELQGYSQRWGEAAIGIVDVEVRPELRRQGLAKFLMVQILKLVQDQYFTLAEMHVLDSNEPTLRLCKGLGFEQVDVGRRFRKSAP